jgi:hypothetical protein
LTAEVAGHFSRTGRPLRGVEEYEEGCMRIAEIFQFGYGQDRGSYDHKNKHDDHGYHRKEDGGYHHRRRYGDGLLRIYISLL